MYSSDATNPASIENVLFHATVQVSTPAVTSTASIATKLRSNSINKESPSTRKIRCSLSALSISPPKPKRPSLNKRKVVRDIVTQTITHSTQNLPDNNNKPVMPTARTSLSTEYLSTPRYYQYTRSTSCYSIKYKKSIKNTLFGIWQGLNNDESRCSTSSLIDQKCFEERIEKVS